MQDPLNIDNLIQGLEFYKKVDYEYSFYLYHALIDALRYSTSIKGAVWMHIIENIFICYYEDYKWCNNCEYTEYNPISTTSHFLTPPRTKLSFH